MRCSSIHDSTISFFGRPMPCPAFRKPYKIELRQLSAKAHLPLLEIALVLVRLDHVASRIVNANHGIVRTAVELRISDCIRDGIRLAIPQPTEWQHIGN